MPEGSWIEMRAVWGEVSEAARNGASADRDGFFDGDGDFGGGGVLRFGVADLMPRD
jgi:hypothetical protein